MPRKNPIARQDREIAQRLKELREFKGVPRDKLNELAGLSPGYLKLLEVVRTPLQYEHARQVMRSLLPLKPGSPFPINPLWLGKGVGNWQIQWPFILPPALEIGLDPTLRFSEFVNAHVKVLAGLANNPPTVPLPAAWVPTYQNYLRSVLEVAVEIKQAEADTVKNLLALSGARSAAESGDSGEGLPRGKPSFLNGSKKGLQALYPMIKSQSVGRRIEKLKSELLELTEPKGMKTVLANYLGVAPSMLSQWLHGDKEPGGETTLRMLEWVQKQRK